MNKLKVGDKVKCCAVVRGTIRTTNDRPKEYCATGIVQEIDGDCIKVLFPACTQWWHRYQCRRPAKVKRCGACDGTDCGGGCASD